MVKQFGRLRGRRMCAKIALSRRIERCHQRLTETHVSTITHYELVTFKRVTLPEIPSSPLLMCPTHSLLDICRSDSVLCRLAIVEF